LSFGGLTCDDVDDSTIDTLIEVVADQLDVGVNAVEMTSNCDRKSDAEFDTVVKTADATTAQALQTLVTELSSSDDFVAAVSSGLGVTVTGVSVSDVEVQDPAGGAGGTSVVVAMAMAVIASLI
jgi:hypothetical protein